MYRRPAANWAALKDPIARLGPEVSAEQTAELRKRAAWPD
jgi:hypothetical protein